MNILIDNKDLYQHFGIKFLDWTPALGIAKEREDNQTWYDKSGIDKNLNHNRYDAREFVIECYTKQLNIETAYLCFKNFAEYLHNQRVVVFSLHSSDLRQAFLVERSLAIAPDINIRQQNCLYYCKIGFRDINPNALVFYKTLNSGTTSLSIDYDKGISANVYWGNGDQGEVSNSAQYTHDEYTSGLTNQLIDIIVDVDKDYKTVEQLIADFYCLETTGISYHTCNFFDTSTGSTIGYSWDFGDFDGKTTEDPVTFFGNESQISRERNPTHTYMQAGNYNVSLTIYNENNTRNVMTKVAYITVRSPRLLYSASSEDAIIHNIDISDNYLIEKF